MAQRTCLFQRGGRGLEISPALPSLVPSQGAQSPAPKVTQPLGSLEPLRACPRAEREPDASARPHLAFLVLHRRTCSFHGARFLGRSWTLQTVVTWKSRLFLLEESPQVPGWPISSREPCKNGHFLHPPLPPHPPVPIRSPRAEWAPGKVISLKVSGRGLD